MKIQILCGLILMGVVAARGQSTNVTLPIIPVPQDTTSFSADLGVSCEATVSTSVADPAVASINPNYPFPGSGQVQIYSPAPPGYHQFVITGLQFGTTTITVYYFTSAACVLAQAEYIFVLTVQVGTPPPPPPTSANTPNTASNGEPVSGATGELFGQDEAPDLVLGGPAGLEFRRYYASFLSTGGLSSALSTNWMHNFDQNVKVSGSTAAVTLFRGKTVTFSQSGNNWALSSNEQRPYQLFNAAGGGYQFLDPRPNLIYSFNASGGLASIADRNGNTITVTQGANGPTSVSDGLGRTLTFSYAGSRLAGVQDQSGRSVSFQYTNGLLTAWTDANGNQTAFSYTSQGSSNALMTSATRPAGNRPFSQTFDSSGRVATQADSFSQTMTFSYSSGNTGAVEAGGINVTEAFDANHNLTSLSDSGGGVSTFTYDPNNRPASSTDRLGNTSMATYDPASGLASSYTDELGNKTSFHYAASAKGLITFYDLTGETFADGTTITLVRDGNGNITSVTDQAGNIWQATYTPLGWLATATNPAGGVYTFNYNIDGTLASLRTPSSDTTNFGYDAVSRLNLITNPDNTARSFLYDAVSNLLKATDERGNSDSATFDPNNNPMTATDALGNAANFAFDTDDQPITAKDPLGNLTASAWDPQSRLASVANSAGNKVVWTYDNLNRVAAVADASGNGLHFGVDQENRVTSITDALNRTTTYTRDAHGNITGAATPKSEHFSYTYDALNRLISWADPLSGRTQFTRDPRGILSSIAIPGGIEAAYGLNSFGLAATVTDPQGNVWSSGYDNMGRLTSKTDPLQQTTSFAYDSRQRVASATFPNGSVHYSYDAAGNFASAQYSDGTAFQYTWDAANRLTAATGIAQGYDADGRITSSNGLQIARDPAGRIASVTYAPGKTVSYTYNNRGLLIQVADWAGGSTTFTYDAAAQLTALAFANGVTEAYTYDADGRVLTIKAAKGGTTLSSIMLTRDALGRVTSAARSAANIPAEVNGMLAMTYDAAAQIAGDSYDGLGRLIKDNQRSYVWDLASHLVSYAGGDGSASFTYDGFGQRLSRTAAGVTETYVWNYAFPLPVLSIVQTGGVDQTYYVWLPDGTLLNSISASDSTRRFYHFDESGSTVLLTDSTGTVTDTYATSIDGNTVTQTGPTANPFTFQGQYGVMAEGASSLYYLRARYLDSAAGRFISRDPITSKYPLAINPYQFAYGNPVEQGDPSGLEPAFFSNPFLESQEYANLGFVDRLCYLDGKSFVEIFYGPEPTGGWRGHHGGIVLPGWPSDCFRPVQSPPVDQRYEAFRKRETDLEQERRETHMAESKLCFAFLAAPGENWAQAEFRFLLEKSAAERAEAKRREEAPMEPPVCPSDSGGYMTVTEEPDLNPSGIAPTLGESPTSAPTPAGGFVPSNFAPSLGTSTSAEGTIGSGKPLTTPSQADRTAGDPALDQAFRVFQGARNFFGWSPWL